MFRSMLNSCLRPGGVTSILQNVSAGAFKKLATTESSRCFSAMLPQHSFNNRGPLPVMKHDLLMIPTSVAQQPITSPLLLQQPSRTVIKFNLKGRRASVYAVTARFKRLDWGIWVRRNAGCHRKLWMKNNKLRMKLERHVFVNATRSYMLDKMVSKYWRTPKYWVDDPYEPYHKREDFAFTRKKPRPLPAGVTFTDD